MRSAPPKRVTLAEFLDWERLQSTRHELIDGLWSGEDEAPNERTIDVHVRRLRSKLAHYQDIVRTVRGVGYRFDRHADVSIRQASTPSPDVF